MICQDDSAFHGYLNGQLGSAVPSHLLKYGFCNKSFRKDEPLTSLTLFSTYLSSKLDSTLCNQSIGEGESNFDDKYVEKVFNWSEVHLSEMTVTKSIL